MSIKFRYFQASEKEMCDLLPGQRVCSLCGQMNRCFRLDSAIGLSWGEKERTEKIGCCECLSMGRFGFVHDTEIGLLVEDRMIGFQEEEEPKQRRVFIGSASGDVTEVREVSAASAPVSPLSARSLEALRRTPNFDGWQDIAWPIDCGDFMVYVGSWTGTDFSEAADGGNGRQLFLEITGLSDYDAGWYWPENKPTLAPAIDVHVLRCSSCEAARGICDHD